MVHTLQYKFNLFHHKHVACVLHQLSSQRGEEKEEVEEMQNLVARVWCCKSTGVVYNKVLHTTDFARPACLN